MLSSDLDDFMNDLRWLFNDNTQIKVRSEYSPGNTPIQFGTRFLETFPTLTQLLTSARVTDVEINGLLYRLWGWTDVQGCSFGWQSPLTQYEAEHISYLHPDHRLLLSSFGGIKERWHEPHTWLLNLNGALTLEVSKITLTTWTDYYHACCEQASIRPTINLDDYCVFAQEANGNCTIYHRMAGDVLMFAHDHAFDHIEQAPQCPPYTFYTIKHCSNFRTWVETVASQWLELVG